MCEQKKFTLGVENLGDLKKSWVSIKIGYDIPVTYRVSYSQMYKYIHSGLLDYENCRITPRNLVHENGYDADRFRCNYQKILEHVTYCIKTRYNSKMLRFIILASIYGNTSLRMMFGSDKAINDYVKSIKFY